MSRAGLTNALAECLDSANPRAALASIIRQILRVVPSPLAKLIGYRRLMDAVAEKRRELGLKPDTHQANLQEAA